jgi:hypothetical protein
LDPIIAAFDVESSLIKWGFFILNI